MIIDRCYKCGLEYPSTYTLKQCYDHVKQCKEVGIKLRHCKYCNKTLLDRFKSRKSTPSYIVTKEPYCNALCRTKYRELMMLLIEDEI